ncbi:MAG: DUF5916 domain-containing protein [Bacteroidota bacterium]
MKVLATFLISFFFCTLLLAQEELELSQIEKKIYETRRVGDQAPQIDGSLDDEAWKEMAWGGGDFTQIQPYENTAPTAQTNFKILHDDKFLYIAFRCYDEAPDKIERRLSRRDGFAGDWVEINLDSYFDQRTAFSFTISAAGVIGDEFVSNNGDNWDSSWNPIWYAKSKIDEQGWTAEIKIPFSQLRFGNKEVHTWGMQFTRRNFRKEERSVWQYIPRNSGVWVSAFGHLTGIKGIRSQKQVEIQPYVVGQTETFEKEEGNPFATGSARRISAGLDGKIGVTSDMVLDFTINPDFGQVEADPSVVNLNGFRVFFREQRPFFIENRNIFDYRVTRSEAGGSFNSDLLFYSRRIGGAPNGNPDINDDEYLNRPSATSILGAAKFSGKTKKGLSIGVLQGITAQEYAEIDSLGERREEVVEPFTNYFVGRIQQDFDGGNTILGGIFTATNRKLDGTGLNFLHKSAYTAGLDIVHKWDNQSWVLTGKGVVSNVNGSTEAITATQESFEHAFDRPDAEHLEVDTSLTSLTGHGATLKIGKFGGKWVFESGVTWRSPELELNDLGFMVNADEINHFFWSGYRINQPFSIFQNLRVNYNHWLRWDFSGRNLYQAVNTNVHTQFKNFWGIGSGVNYEFLDIDNNALFGGPALRKPNGLSNWMYAYTDNRKKLNFNWNMFHVWGAGETVRIQDYSLFIRYQPTNAFNVSFGPSFNRFRRPVQNVTSEDYNGTTRYIAGRVNQKTLSATIRLNYSISPNLSLQYYGQPFISQVKYSEFKYITNPLSEEFQDRFHAYDDSEIRYDDEEEVYIVDETKDGIEDYSFGNPDFSFIQFRSNFVMRWEYTPGSELFLVWSQSNTATGNPHEGIFRDLKTNLFENKGTNIFLIKYTYRFIK